MPRRDVGLIFLAPAPGREGEVSTAVDVALAPALLSLDGVQGAQVFAVRPEFMHFPAPPGLVALLLELATEDSASTLEGVAAMLRTDSAVNEVDRSQTQIYALEQWRDEQVHPGLPADFRTRSPRGLLIFFLGPIPSRDAEYQRWYDTRHIPDGLTLPGFVTAQRFTRGRQPAGFASPSSEFQVIYEIMGASVDEAISAAAESAARFEHSDAADTLSMRAYALTSRGPLHVGR